MRTLAIDFGTRRIGLAMSDAGGTIANPIEVIAVSSPQLAIEPIVKLIEREGVERVIVGLPLNMDGSRSAQTELTIAWVNDLKKQLAAEIKGTYPFISSEPGAIRRDVPLIFVDERLSSFAAEQQLSARKAGGEKLTRKSKKQMLDALVAANLLQEFLDGKLPGLDVKRDAP